MKFNLTCTDKDGIITSITIDSELQSEEDWQDVFVKLIKFFDKNGANVPEEILEQLNEF